MNSLLCFISASAARPMQINPLNSPEMHSICLPYLTQPPSGHRTYSSSCCPRDIEVVQGMPNNDTGAHQKETGTAGISPCFWSEDLLLCGLPEPHKQGGI